MLWAIILIFFQIGLAVCATATAWPRAGRQWRALGWLGLAMGVAGAGIILAWLGQGYAGHYRLSALSPMAIGIMLSLVMGSGLASGAAVMTCAMRGWTGGHQLQRIGAGMQHARPVLKRYSRDLRRVLLVRALLVTMAFGLGMTLNPMGPRFFIASLRMTGGLALFNLRLILGLILPLLGSLLVDLAVDGDEQAQAHVYFIPILMFAVLGELLAAGFAVGLGGIYL